MNQKQYQRMGTGNGFIAALDQSGGSTPKALGLYGIDGSQYSTEQQMFDLMHAMRARIIKSPAFSSDSILGAILFAGTIDRKIDGVPTVKYLWEHKGVVPFLKVDLGMLPAENGAQKMKPIPGIKELLEKAQQAGVFGTKMRSFISAANPLGIHQVAEQQFEFANTILKAGLVPIIEPEIDIHCPEKQAAEELLLGELESLLSSVPDGSKVMFKLSIPSNPLQYQSLASHPKVLRLVALSGGYSRVEANRLLGKTPNMIASFSRALTEGLSANQTDAEFDTMLADSIHSIYQASVEK